MRYAELKSGLHADQKRNLRDCRPVPTRRRGRQRIVEKLVEQAQHPVTVQPDGPG
jgi:hypothetical protein